MQTGDYMSSDELTQDEFDKYNKSHEDVLETLYGVIAERDEAKAFLSTKFGIALRSALVSEQLRAMKACAESTQPEAQEVARIQYKVIQKVQFIFGLIISDGDEALRQLKLTQGDNDGHRN